jgi:hypothetical protein
MSNTDSLYSEIMNLPAKCYVITDPDNIRWYKSGHRDARHDAAGLVAAHASAHEEKIKRLREALERIAAIEDKYTGSDWEEIEEARVIARTALSTK